MALMSRHVNLKSENVVFSNLMTLSILNFQYVPNNTYSFHNITRNSNKMVQTSTSCPFNKNDTFSWPEILIPSRLRES